MKKKHSFEKAANLSSIKTIQSELPPTTPNPNSEEIIKNCQIANRQMNNGNIRIILNNIEIQIPPKLVHTKPVCNGVCCPG